MAKLSALIKPPAALDETERAAWAAMRAQNPMLYSPYFHFGYAQALARLLDDVYILILKRGERIAGFMPFQATAQSCGGTQKFRFARPLGSPMTDYHGLICGAHADIDIAPALKLAGIDAFHFTTLIDSSGGFARHSRAQTPCAMADISAGAAQWRESRDSSYRRHLKSNRRRIRKSEDIGERTFSWRSDDAAAFDTLMIWKQEKFAETGKFDVLSAGWTKDMLHALWQSGLGDMSGKARRDADLRAEMHTLSIGGELAAIDLGLTDGKTFHSWIVAYNAEFHTLAPGIQLLEALIDEAAALGYTRIDLGEGLDGYKRHYASEDVNVHSGYVAASGAAAAITRLYGAAETLSEKHFGRIGRLPGKARRRYAQIQACEPRPARRALAMLAAAKGAPSQPR